MSMNKKQQKIVLELLNQETRWSRISHLTGVSYSKVRKFAADHGFQPHPKGRPPLKEPAAPVASSDLLGKLEALQASLQTQPEPVRADSPKASVRADSLKSSDRIFPSGKAPRLSRSEYARLGCMIRWARVQTRRAGMVLSDLRQSNMMANSVRPDTIEPILFFTDQNGHRVEGAWFQVVCQLADKKKPMVLICNQDRVCSIVPVRQGATIKVPSVLRGPEKTAQIRP